MLFEVELPEKYHNLDVTCVSIHMSIENYEPVKMMPRPRIRDNDSYSSSEEANLTKSSLYQRVATRHIREQRYSNTGLTRDADETKKFDEEDKSPRVFFIFRMVPPSQKGLTYYFSLLNPRNFRQETFIDKTIATTYV